MTKTTLLGAAIATLISGLSSGAFAQPRTFEVDTRRSRAMFVSDAPIDRFEGVNDQVRGQVTFDPNDVSAVRGTIEVPVASFRTGIELRDDQLRSESWLDAAHHPTVTFEIREVTGPQRLEPNRAMVFEVRGRFSARGRSRDIAVRTHVKLVPDAGDPRGDVLRVRATFTVKLDDYGMSIPAILQLKLSNELTVTVDLWASPREGG